MPFTCIRLHLAGVVITPLLALLLLGTRIPVDAVGMAASIAQIVMVPIAAGAAPLSCPACNLLLTGHARPFPQRTADQLDNTLHDIQLPQLGILYTHQM